MPEKLGALFSIQDLRYRVAHGGRGGAKSRAFADALILKALESKRFILCTREVQKSINDSVFKLLTNSIERLGLQTFFDVGKSYIRCINGSEFAFRGIRFNVNEIKSMEGVDICWVEEAQTVTQNSWDILIPTIRAPGSEIWVTFNPVNVDDPTYQEFIVNKKPRSVVVEINWRDNPWFPAELEEERSYMKEVNPDLYDHIWEGRCLSNAEAQIFGNKYYVEEFDSPENGIFYHGADWGFSNDPTALVRCFIKDECLWIDYEAFGKKVELNKLPDLFEKIPNGKKKRWIGDNARPETMSYLRKVKGINVMPCDKWPGSIEDGIEVLRAFRRIYIHPRCVNMIEEAKLYSYKIDSKTEEVTTQIVDAYNHGWDAVRYALNKRIRLNGKVNLHKLVTE